jgi:hypothetical protein
MAVKYGITIIATVEYRKLMEGQKPTNNDIAESRSLEYDSTVIIHLYNDLHHAGPDDAILIHKDEDGKILPRIWCKFGKNKVSGFEGREFLDLYGANGTYRSVDLDTAVQHQRDRLAFLKENKQLSF